MIAPDNSYPKFFIVFVALACLAIFVFENINHRFWLNDFKVYYGGATALLNGEQVYGVLYSLGSGYYKYSPFTALLAIPFCLFNFNTAAIFQFFILSFSIILLFFEYLTRFCYQNDTENPKLTLALISQLH